MLTTWMSETCGSTVFIVYTGKGREVNLAHSKGTDVCLDVGQWELKLPRLKNKDLGYWLFLYKCYAGREREVFEGEGDQLHFGIWCDVEFIQETLQHKSRDKPLVQSW